MRRPSALAYEASPSFFRINKNLYLRIQDTLRRAWNDQGSSCGSFASRVGSSCEELVISLFARNSSVVIRSDSPEGVMKDRFLGGRVIEACWPPRPLSIVPSISFFLAWFRLCKVILSITTAAILFSAPKVQYCALAVGSHVENVLGVRACVDWRHSNSPVTAGLLACNLCHRPVPLDT